MKLSVLDQSPIRRGGTATEAIHETLELAQAADRLGYSRYWLAEHHNSRGLASPVPEVLIAEVAMRTQHLRVGSGGVMLTHYSPLKVAETFRMLEALHPGRIDLGIGRAPGSDTYTARLLAQGRPGIDAYAGELLELYGFLSNSFPEGDPLARIHAMPEVETMPELWLLGSSIAGAQYAAELGWSFCFAHFINPHSGLEAVETYRRHFQPSPFLAEPRVMVAVSATCADTTAEAERLSWSRWYWRVGGGALGGIPSPEEALAAHYTPAEQEYLDFARSISMFGDPAAVRAKLLAVADQFGAGEVMVVTITYAFAARVHSYELLAKEFGLAPVRGN